MVDESAFFFFGRRGRRVAMANSQERGKLVAMLMSSGSFSFWRAGLLALLMLVLGNRVGAYGISYKFRIDGIVIGIRYILYDTQLRYRRTKMFKILSCRYGDPTVPSAYHRMAAILRRLRRL